MRRPPRIAGAALAWLAAALLAGCASAPPAPGKLVTAERLAQAVIPGHSTRAKLLADLGPTHRIGFDSGYEVWLYRVAAAGGRTAEFVILLDPAGVVRKTRRREPSALDVD